MTRIDELKKLSPQERAASIQNQLDRNRAFFERKNPAIAKHLALEGCEPFHIRVDQRFMSIYDKRTGKLCHPEAGLDRFAESLGDWTNQAWIDLVEGRAITHSDQRYYSQMLTRFNQALFSQFPALGIRAKQRLINLPDLQNGKHFSNAVVFFGIFHGLHIDYYLSRTQVRNVAFIEPELPRFVLSCCFLDYEALEKQFDGLILHIGNDFPHQHIEQFFKRSYLSAPTWTRILPGYASDKIEPLMRQFRLKWKSYHDTWAPPDDSLAGLKHAMENIASGRLIFSGGRKLSGDSRIAVVGSGPSLTSDLPALRKHQDQLIIFAAHSAVSALKSAGIEPDFQFNIEIREWTPEIFEKLQLDPEIPIVTMVADVPEKFKGFKTVLMLPETGGMAPVKFNYSVPFISPTTGNTAVGFALRCQPKEIFLFGLDFGFRSALETHSKASVIYKDEKDQKGLLGTGQLMVEPNFDSAEGVYTRPYFNIARLAVQRAVSVMGQQVSVYNCADGARIEGAMPCRAEDIALGDYDKSVDIETIRSMFSPLEEGVHWSPLELSGKEQLDAYKKAAIKEMKMAKFNWLKFVQRMDGFRQGIGKKLPSRVATNADVRISPYLYVLEELLVAWYRLLCFTNTAEEWQQVYKVGYEKFAELVEEMEWKLGV